MSEDPKPTEGRIIVNFFRPPPAEKALETGMNPYTYGLMGPVIEAVEGFAARGIAVAQAAGKLTALLDELVAECPEDQREAAEVAIYLAFASTYLSTTVLTNPPHIPGTGPLDVISGYNQLTLMMAYNQVRQGYAMIDAAVDAARAEPEQPKAEPIYIRPAPGQRFDA